MPFFSGRCYSNAKLVGKTAIVTGCNTGIGKETVLDFYKRGKYKLYLTFMCDFFSTLSFKIIK